jgi:hypothetical protein
MNIIFCNSPKGCKFQEKAPFFWTFCLINQPANLYISQHRVKIESGDQWAKSHESKNVKETWKGKPQYFFISQQP